MVRMGHLRLAPIEIDLAADNPRFSNGQNVLKVFLVAAKEDQIDHARIVGTAHTIGHTGVARHLMLFHPHLHGGEFPFRRVADFGPVAAVDHAGGQSPQQIHHFRAGHPFHQFFNARPHAF